jgi:twinfilin-like protein
MFAASKELVSTFANGCGEVPTIHFLHVRIVNEKFELCGSSPRLASEKAVYDAIRAASSLNAASYFPIRLTAANRWTLLTFIPDTAPVKDKMLYAASLTPLKKELGFSCFADDIMCSEQNELTHSHQEQVKAIGKDRTTIMTEIEKLGMEDRLMEKDSINDARTKTLIAFPVTPEVVTAVDDFTKNKLDMIQLYLVTDKEHIAFRSSKGKVSGNDLRDSYASDIPTYTVYRYSGQAVTQPTVVMFLTCPPAAPVKARMMAATVKTSLIKYLEQSGINVTKQFDTDSATDEGAVASSLEVASAQPESLQPSAARPSQPGKGGRRLVGGAGRKELED